MAIYLICTIDGCGKTAEKRGWCGMHYRRWQRHGDPLAGGAPRQRNDGKCLAQGCDSPARSRGYCQKHYARVYRTGQDQVAGTLRGEPMDYLNEVVMAHTGDECLAWPFSRNSYGYGQVWDGEKMERVHRIVCERMHGPPPSPEHHGAHSCGRGHEACVSPHHIRWDTRVGNVADKLEHGTHNRGERNEQHKLTEDEVRHIRRLRGSRTHKEIADMFGVTRSNVSAILRGQSWAWLE